MSKIVSQLLDGNTWVGGVSTINTVIFTLLFVVIIIGVLRMKKNDVDEYKNLPLNDDDTDLI